MAKIREKQNFLSWSELKIAEGEFLPFLFKPWRWHKRPFRYFSRDMSTGARLKDGRAVMVTIPDLCYAALEAQSFNTKEIFIQEDFLPLVAFVDDPDDPQVIKLITSRSYYRHSDRELDILEYKVSAAPKDSFPSWQDDFNWLRSHDPAAAALGYDAQMNFNYWHLAELPLEVYREGSPEDVPVDEAKGLVSLYDLPGFKVPESMKRRYPASYFSRIYGWGIFGGSFYSIGSESDPHLEYISYDHLIPVFQTNEGNVYDINKRGFLMLYRRDRSQDEVEETLHWNEDRTSIVSRTRIKKYLIGPKNKQIQITSESHQKRGRHTRIRAPYFYDPATRHVFWLTSRTFAFNR